jgi:hypothetical protein
VRLSSREGLPTKDHDMVGVTNQVFEELCREARNDCLILYQRDSLLLLSVSIFITLLPQFLPLDFFRIPPCLTVDHGSTRSTGDVNRPGDITTYVQQLRCQRTIPPELEPSLALLSSLAPQPGQFCACGFGTTCMLGPLGGDDWIKSRSFTFFRYQSFLASRCFFDCAALCTRRPSTLRCNRGRATFITQVLVWSVECGV